MMDASLMDILTVLIVVKERNGWSLGAYTGRMFDSRFSVDKDGSLTIHTPTYHLTLVDIDGERFVLVRGLD